MKNAGKPKKKQAVSAPGKYKDNLARAIPLQKKRREPKSFVSIVHAMDRFREVEEKLRKAEEVLKKSEKKYRDLFENANDAIFILDAEQNYVDVNKKAIELLGYSREELLQRNVFDFIPEDQKGRSRIEFDKLKHEGRYEKFRGRGRTKDGRWLDIDVSSSAIMDGEDYIGSIDIVRDVTDRVKAEKSLRENEARMKEAQQIAHIGNWAWDIRTNEVYWSDELYRIYGYEPFEILPDYEFVVQTMHPESREKFSNAIKAALKGERPFEMEYAFFRKDRSVATLHTIGHIVYDENNNPERMVGIVQDITDRKHAEEALRNRERFIRNILDTVDEGFIVIDRDFRILTANKAYCGQAAIAFDQVIDRHCYEISHQASRPCHEKGEECAVRHVFDTGESHTAVHRHANAKGEFLYVETKAFPIKDSSGRVASVIETVNNITEKHLLEEERLKTQKLEAIGTLAGGIAHDFNNLLQGIFGYISLAKRTLDRREDSLAMLDQAEKALRLTTNLTSQLLTFSKGGKPVRKPIALRPVIENGARFALSGSRSDCRIDIEDRIWNVEADEGQIGQIIQNIVLNADQAMPEGGTVEITARNLSGEMNRPRGLGNRDYIEISIRDTGIGIPEKYIAKIFDPYFTTKEKGSGLGLATSYSIIRNHDGLIRVKSEVGVGTVFSIYLPAIAAAVEKQPVTVSSRASRRGRVLIMDDEAMVRQVAGELVRALGHQVEFAENGESAIAHYRKAREAGNPFDILILDLTIRGGMGGAEVLPKLLEIDPHVKAIVSSGYSNDAIISEHQKCGFKGFLKKPYHLEELRDILNALLSME